MLLFSMSVSVDGYVADRDGRFDWSSPDDELFAAHLEEVSGLGAYLLGRRLYELMLVWENDPAIRSDPARTRFAEVWTALPKVVFARPGTPVQGTARLARGTLRDEVDAALALGTGDVSIGGPTLAAAALAEGLVDGLSVFRHPVVVGGGTPYLPPLADPLRLELVSTRAFPAGAVHERYRRVAESSKPAAGGPS